MILVTGALGFIGGHLSRRLLGDFNQVVYMADKQDDIPAILRDGSDPITAVFHLGAISDTTCEDYDALYFTNIDLSHHLSHFCGERGIPFIYASSASVYGNGDGPLNLYAQSKEHFDRVMIATAPSSPWYGLRFFNVYGPGEEHKGKQASMVHQIIEEMKAHRTATLFDIDARRDFVHVDDVVSVMLWLWKNRSASGIYDVGTGWARLFEAIPAAIPLGGSYLLQRKPMHESLKGKYQFHTQADLTKLRAAGYDKPFLSLEEGVARMLNPK